MGLKTWEYPEFKAGYAAYKSGKPRADNPHVARLSIKLWYAGWAEAWWDDK